MTFHEVSRIACAACKRPSVAVVRAVDREADTSTLQMARHLGTERGFCKGSCAPVEMPEKKR